MTETLRAELAGGPCCAHLHIEYVRIDHGNGLCSDSWQCRDCKTPFWSRAGRESASKGEGQEYEIVDFATGVSGSLCIGRKEGAFMSYWNPDGWAGAGSVFTDRRIAEAVIAGFKHAPSSPGSERDKRCPQCASDDPKKRIVSCAFGPAHSWHRQATGSEREAARWVSIDEHGPCPKCHHVHPVGAVTLAYAYTRCTYSGPGPMETCNCNFPIDDFVNEDGS